MRDAVGGSVIITWILIFLVVITSILAFSFNYTKAFRLKNAVLDIIEEGQGLTEGDNGTKFKITSTMNRYGYGNNFTVPGYKCRNGVCIKFNPKNSDTRLKSKYCGTRKNCSIGSYSVITFIYVNVPIIVDALETIQARGGLRIQGETSTMRLSCDTCDSW